jgi:hypothetical protein
MPLLDLPQLRRQAKATVLRIKSTKRTPILAFCSQDVEPPKQQKNLKRL